MKIQTPTPFLAFKDGFCDIYTVTGNQLSDKVMTLPYGRRVLGGKRFYAARAASITIDLLIEVPRQFSITAAHNAVIEGMRYRIEQVQHIDDTNPPSTVLTLRKIGVTV